MKSRFGNIKLIDGLPYAVPRKKYTRTKPIKRGWFKINPLKRERAAIIKLTRLGYSINILAEFLGRSTSFIHKTTRMLHAVDKRKLPNAIRLRCSSIRRRMLLKYWSRWEMWILGEGDRPP